MIKNAEYICCKCNYKYFDYPGPTSCPKCGNLYVEWKNYEYLKKNVFGDYYRKIIDGK